MGKEVTQPTFRMMMIKLTIHRRKQNTAAENRSSTKAWQMMRTTNLTMKMTILMRKRNRDASEMNSERTGHSQAMMMAALRHPIRNCRLGRSTTRSCVIFKKSSRGCRVESKNCRQRSRRSFRRVQSWSERSSSKSVSTFSTARANM